MDPRLLRAWDLRPEVVLTLLLAGVLFTLGWWRLRRESSHRFARMWRLVAYSCGLGVLTLALLSPLDTLSSYLLSAHMVQHLLLMMLAPALLMVANPLAFGLWGLPESARPHVGGLLKRGSFLRRVLTAVTAPGVVWLMLVIVLVGWHDPRAYDAALRSEAIHNLEHLTFFAVALLFWWHVIGAGPRLHSASYGLRIGLLLLTVPITMGLGVVIALTARPIYLNYLTAPRVLGLSVMGDQQLAGAIMWIPGSMMLILATLALLSQVVKTEADKPPQPLDSVFGDPTPTRPPV